MKNKNLEFERINDEYMEIWSIETPEAFPVCLSTVKIPLPEFFNIEKAQIGLNNKNKLCIFDNGYEVVLPVIEKKIERKIYDPTHLPSDPNRRLDILIGDYIYGLPVQKWTCRKEEKKDGTIFYFRGNKKGNFCLYKKEYPENTTLYTLRTPYKMRSSLFCANPIRNLLHNIFYGSESKEIDMSKFWIIGAMQDNCNATVVEMVNWKEMVSGEIQLPSPEIWKKNLKREIPFNPRFKIGKIYLTRAWKLVNPLREAITYKITTEEWSCLKVIKLLRELKHAELKNSDMVGEELLPYTDDVWYYL